MEIRIRSKDIAVEAVKEQFISLPFPSESQGTGRWGARHVETLSRCRLGVEGSEGCVSKKGAKGEGEEGEEEEEEEEERCLPSRVLFGALCERAISMDSGKRTTTIRKIYFVV